MAPNPNSRPENNFAASSALILFAVFVALVVAAGYLGHVMAGSE